MIKKEVAINLFGLIRDIKNSNLSREAFSQIYNVEGEIKITF